MVKNGVPGPPKWSKMGSGVSIWGPRPPKWPKMVKNGQNRPFLHVPGGVSQGPFGRGIGKLTSFSRVLQTGLKKYPKNDHFWTPSERPPKGLLRWSSANRQKYESSYKTAKRCRVIWPPKWPFLTPFLRPFWGSFHGVVSKLDLFWDWGSRPLQKRVIFGVSQGSKIDHFWPQMLEKCLYPQCGRIFCIFGVSGAFFYKNGTLRFPRLFFKSAKTAIFVIFRVFSSFFSKFHQKWPFLTSCSKVSIALIPFSTKMDKKLCFCKKCFSNTFFLWNEFRKFLEFEKVKKWQKVSFLLFFAKNDKNELVVF